MGVVRDNMKSGEREEDADDRLDAEKKIICYPQEFQQASSILRNKGRMILGHKH